MNKKYLSGEDLKEATVIGFAENGIGSGEFTMIQLRLNDGSFVYLQPEKKLIITYERKPIDAHMF